MKQQLFYLVTLVSLVLCIQSVKADGWFYQATLSSNVEADDNRRLRTDDEKGVVGINARGGLNLSHESEVSKIYVRGVLSSVRYDGGDDRAVDSDDQLLYTGAEWIGERSRFTIDGEYLRRSTQLTELEDTGFLEDVERREDISVSPQISYIISEKTQAFVGANYIEVDFPNATPVSLTEYSVQGANAGVVYNFDPHNSITVSAFTSEYDADTFSNEVNTTGGNVRYDKTVNELWSGYAQVGYRKSNFKNRVNGIDVRDDDSGESYEFGIMRVTDVSTLNLSVSNELQPSADGDVNERLDLGLSYSQSISPRLTAGVRFNWFEDESINNDAEEDREYWTLSFNGDFRLTEQWYITGQLRHREQMFDREGVSGSERAESDAVIIGVRFNGNKNRI